MRHVLQCSGGLGSAQVVDVFENRGAVLAKGLKRGCIGVIRDDVTQGVAFQCLDRYAASSTRCAGRPLA